MRGLGGAGTRWIRSILAMAGGRKPCMMCKRSVRVRVGVGGTALTRSTIGVGVRAGAYLTRRLASSLYVRVGVEYEMTIGVP